MKSKEFLVKNILSIISIFASIISLTVFSGLITKNISEPIIALSIGVCTTIIFNFAYNFLSKREKSIFIIYNHEDSQIVKVIANDLKSKKFDVLLDLDLIKPGENINDKINYAIKKSNKIIVIFSKKSWDSKWVKAELGKVLEMQKSVIPVIISEDFTIPDEMKNIKYADLTNYNLEKLDKLISSLN